MAIGWRAARPWSSIPTAASRSSNGPPTATSPCSSRAWSRTRMPRSITPRHETYSVRLALVTDAWQPQMNGVVRTLMRTCDELRAMGHEVTVISPDQFNGFPCPTYPEIKLAFLPRRKIARTLGEFDPQAIHIATEGPLGHAARGYCQAHGLPFTTAYHTRFPEYVQARFNVPVGLSYAWLRRFHGAARSMMVA